LTQPAGDPIAASATTDTGATDVKLFLRSASMSSTVHTKSEANWLVEMGIQDTLDQWRGEMEEAVAEADGQQAWSSTTVSQHLLDETDSNRADSKAANLVARQGVHKVLENEAVASTEDPVGQRFVVQRLQQCLRSEFAEKIQKKELDGLLEGIFAQPSPPCSLAEQPQQ